MKNYINNMIAWWAVKKQIRAAKKVIIPFAGAAVARYGDYLEFFDLMVSHKAEIIDLVTRLSQSADLTPETLQQQAVMALSKIIHAENQKS